MEISDRQRHALLRILRLAFLVIFLTVTVLSVLSYVPGTSVPAKISLAEYWPLTLSVALGLAAVVLLVDIFTPRKEIAMLVSIFLGLLAAMLATVAVASLIDLLANLYDIQLPSLISLTKILVGIGLAYLCITTVLQTQDDFRLVIPYVEFSKQIRGPKPLVLDSSALIDARIADLAVTGFIQAPLVIPHFVLAELQLLGDSGEKLKRAKGRRGLETAARLQRSTLDVTIDETPVPGKAVDQMLVELSRRMPGTIVTADAALARVAQIQGVSILNLNDVANALRPALIPGEQLSVRLFKPGEQPGQGVGYLDDGTMVVVEHGADRIGRDARVEVTSSLQTSAGRLLFARLVEDGEAGAAGPARTSEPGSPPPPQAQADEAGGLEAAAGEAAGTESLDSPADLEAGSPESQRRSGPFPPKRARPNPARNPRR